MDAFFGKRMNLIVKDKNSNSISFSPLIVGGSSYQMINGLYDEDFFEKLKENNLLTFDLGRVYGNGKAEENFSSYLKWLDRDKVTIITKCCHPLYGIFKRVSKKAAFNDIESSLKALNTSYVDVLLLHRDDENVDAKEIITFMNEILEKGYTRLIGVSNWSVDRIKEANEYAIYHSLEPFKVNEPQFSLAIRNKDPWHNGSKTITGDSHFEDRKYLKENGIINLCYSSLADGFMAGKYNHDDKNFKKNLSHFSKTAYFSQNNLEILKRCENLAKEKGVSVAQLSLAYVLNQDFNTRAIVNFSSARRISENVKAIEIKLSDREKEYLING